MELIFVFPPRSDCCIAFLYASKTTAAPWIRNPVSTKRSSPMEEMPTPTTMTQTVRRTRMDGSGFRMPMLQQASSVATGPIAFIHVREAFLRRWRGAYLQHLDKAHTEIQICHVRQYQTHTEAHPNRQDSRNIKPWRHLCAPIDESRCPGQNLRRDCGEEHMPCCERD
jgi:hypothetical protein